MNASIPLAVLPADNPVNGLGSGIKADLKQSVDGSSEGFSALLGEAVSSLTGESAAAPAIAGPAENLLRQLQVLPQGGKLLPLLNQVLDGAAAAGIPEEHVFAQLNSSLEQLSTGMDLSPLQAIAAALQQVVAANPRYLGRADSADLMLAQRFTAETLQQASGLHAHRSAPLTSEQLTPGSGTHAMEKLLVPVPQQPAAPAAAQAELATALNAIRRLAGADRPTADAAPKAEPVTGLTAPSTSAQPVSGTPILTVSVPLQQANWDQSLGDRIQWLVGQGAQGAQIKLNPAHLGPMEVRIQMQNDQANIQFTATHAVVREALEAALPRLREMLGASGVELVNVDVSGESFAEQQRTGGDPRTAHRADGGIDGPEPPESVIETPLIARPETGRLDLFV